MKKKYQSFFLRLREMLLFFAVFEQAPLEIPSVWGYAMHPGGGETWVFQPNLFGLKSHPRTILYCFSC